MTPLMTPIFDFHLVVSSLTTPSTIPTTTPSLVKTSLYLFHSQISRLKNNTGFSNELPKFDKNIFDDQQNERIVGRFVAMTDSEVDNLIETEGNANTKSERKLQEIVALILFHRCLYNKQNIICSLVDRNFNLLVSISHSFAAFSREISTSTLGHVIYPLIGEYD